MVCGGDGAEEGDEETDVLAKAREERETKMKSRSIKRALRALEDVPVGPTPRMRALWDRRLRGISQGSGAAEKEARPILVHSAKSAPANVGEHSCADDQPSISEMLEHMDPEDPRLSLFAMCGGEDLRQIHSQALSSKEAQLKEAPASSLSEALSTVMTPKRLALLLENAKAEVGVSFDQRHGRGNAQQSDRAQQDTEEDQKVEHDVGLTRTLARANYKLAESKDIEEVVKATTDMQMRTWLLRES